MNSTDKPVHIYFNRIKSEKADDWEAFTRSVIGAVVASQQPEMLDRVRLLRADSQEDGATLFVFIFHGGDIDDYNLEPLFDAEYGEQAGRQRLQEWHDMFARDQYGWTFREVATHD